MSIFFLFLSCLHLFLSLGHLTLVYMFILITILQHYSQTLVVEEVATRPSNEETQPTTRKRSADEMMNRNDPTNKRVCVHHDASSKVTPTPTPVSRKKVCYILLISFLFTIFISLLYLYVQFPNSPTTHRLPLLRKSLLVPSMRNLLVREVLKMITVRRPRDLVVIMMPHVMLW